VNKVREITSLTDKDFYNMPTLIELFKNQKISSGPDTGKTVEEAYAVQNSKIVPIQVTNPILQPLTEKINQRRKDTLRLGETRLEQETAGLKAFSDTAKLVLYGGDYFRIINGTTRSKQLMLRSIGASGAGFADSLTDKIGSAVGNLVSDKISNLFLKKEDRVRPKLDTRALGTDILADVASRTLGRLLPEPMIPSKVVEEFEKGRTKKEQDFVHEYDIDKKIIRLKNKKGIPKLIDGLLKNNKDIMGQTKDVLMSTAGTIAGGLVSAGIGKLSNLIFNKRKNKKGGNNQTTQPTTSTGFKWSSEQPYSAKRNLATLTNPEVLDRNDLSTVFLEAKITAYESMTGKRVSRPGEVPILSQFQFPQLGINPVLESLKKEPIKYSDYDRITKENKFKKRGISDGADALNIMNSIVYSGQSATLDAEGNTADSYDYIPLKFYSIHNNETLQFRCTIADLSETFTPSWEPNKFIGNPFSFYTYSGIERSVSFSFKIFSLNLMEHQFNWERINELASYTYPQDYKGISGAIVPPILKITIGNLYKNKECFIDSLTYTVDEASPWEIGMNKKLTSPIVPKLLGGFVYSIDENNPADEYKLPMIMNVEITLRFIEGRNNTSPNSILYGYTDFTPKNITTPDINTNTFTI
jgi:hypothetical protein